MLPSRSASLVISPLIRDREVILHDNFGTYGVDMSLAPTGEGGIRKGLEYPQNTLSKIENY